MSVTHYMLIASYVTQVRIFQVKISVLFAHIIIRGIHPLWISNQITFALTEFIILCIDVLVLYDPIMTPKEKEELRKSVEWSLKKYRHTFEMLHDL